METMEHDQRRSQAALVEYLSTIQHAQNKFLSQQPIPSDIYIAFERSNEILSASVIDYGQKRLQGDSTPALRPEGLSQEHTDKTMWEDWTNLGVENSLEEERVETERVAFAQNEEADPDQHASLFMEGVQFPVPEVPEDDVPQEGVLDEELLEDEVPEDKVAEDEVVTITISPTQHQQLLGMFGENYPLDHFLIHAYFQPILSDSIVETLYSHDYDDMWIQAYGISDEYLEGWISKYHLHKLFGKQDALKNGDKISFTARSSSGIQVERSVRIQNQPGVKGLQAQIDTGGYESQDLTVDLVKGVTQLIRKVTEHFGDHVDIRKTDLYRALKIWRDGELVGTVYDVRQRYTLWAVMLEMWARRTGRHGASGPAASTHNGLLGKLPVYITTRKEGKSRNRK
ncbi:MAG: hypothetical protein LQ352_004289 [Teloschistes flavicans]|nr:MAG: hypothetical protein LQ352_004289 [Teloschistes flavicans]